jgi:hypothetical protein
VPPSRVDGTPYPRDGTPEEKWAWARADTARRTAEAEAAEPGEATTRWLAEDEWEPEAEDGWDDGLWLMPVDPGDLVAVIRRPAPTRMPGTQQRTRTRRRSQQRARPGGSRSPPDDPSPSPEPPPKRPYELGRLDVASVRLWAHVRRRETWLRVA